MKCFLHSVLMFGVKVVKDPVSITYLCHMYWITTLKNIIYRILVYISYIGIFLCPNIGIVTLFC